MKKIVILLAALLVFDSVSAQPCFPEGIKFTTQAQIDNFSTAYPGCNEIEGNVTICGYNITNLDGLSVITSLYGTLRIVSNQSLTSLTGLSNLDYIGGNLYIGGNILLGNLAGLQNLSLVAGDLQITDNVGLASLSGLEGLAFLGGDLWINDNPVLTVLTGLDQLATVAGIVRIYSNSALVSLTGLENLTGIGGSLVIGGEGHLGGTGNPALQSLDALSNVTSVGGNLIIGYNTALAGLSGLDNIDPGSIMDLNIFDNSSLAACEVQSICAYLGSPNGNVDISNNAAGCNSPEEVEEACVLISGGQIRGNPALSLYPNPSTGSLTIEIPKGVHKAIVSIVNFTGRELFRQEITGPGSYIDISFLPAGIYLVRISDDMITCAEKIIKR